MSTSGREAVPVDPDVDLHVPDQRRTRALDPAVLGVIALGGIAGSEARYALGRWWPAADGGWPTSVFAVNLAGSFLLGALMVVLTELTSPHRLLRPFLGVGVLGGFTTFSTAMLDVAGLVRHGSPVLAAASLVLTALGALGAAALGGTAVRAATRPRLRRRATSERGSRRP